MEENLDSELTSDWSLYNNFTKRLKPGCSKQNRKKLLLENNIPGIKDDELPLLKAYVHSIDQQLDMVLPALEDLRFQHSISPFIGFSFGIICLLIMLIAYAI